MVEIGRRYGPKKQLLYLSISIYLICLLSIYHHHPPIYQIYLPTYCFLLLLVVGDTGAVELLIEMIQ